ncbi:HAD family hydrolase [Micavibrio aeruginosavorus]|uniref:HAD family hydrolase n=1 Tax=Micavibrio aeruginosavorus TaxID=349221 RepID=UPI003F4AA50C
MLIKSKSPIIDRDISGVLWDLDNTLYRLDAMIEHAFNHAVARAALSLGVALPLDEAVTMAHQSYVDHGFSGYRFLQDYGLNRLDLHHRFHDYIDETVIAKNNETRDLFASVKADHALITHGSRVWALKVLEHLELQPFFPDPRVFAYENYDFESKAKSRKPFEMALSSINKNPETVVMVEDTLDNLRIPHEMGMTTIFLHHGREPAALPDFVDHTMQTAQDVLINVLKSPKA